MIDNQGERNESQNLKQLATHMNSQLVSIRIKYISVDFKLYTNFDLNLSSSPGKLSDVPGPYRYDEVSLSYNFSKPVLLGQPQPPNTAKNEDLFAGISFSSPLGKLSSKFPFLSRNFLLLQPE